MTKKYLYLLGIVLATEACQTDDSSQYDDALGREPICITACSIQETPLTRTSNTDLLLTTFASGDLINVNVYKGEDMLISSGNYRANAPSGSTNSLTAVTAAYWPGGTSSSGSIDIIGLYPNNVTASSTSFTVQADQSSDDNYKLSDLMIARCTEATKSSQQALQFCHKMARVVVTVECATELEDVIIQGVNIVDLYRTIGFNPYSGNLDGSALSNQGTIVMQKNGTANSMTAVALVPPQTIPLTVNCIEIDTNNGKAYYNTATTSGNSSSTERIRTELTLEAGKTYTLKLQLYKSKIQMGFDIVEFRNGDEDELLGYFTYTGNEQTFTAGYSGTYRFRAWGAAGTTIGSMRGGYGGYAVGDLTMSAGQTVYLSVGGSGSTTRWNGGGNASSGYGAGGGASHVATSSGLRIAVSLNDIIVIAGGGGGASSLHIGGDGCAEVSGGYLAGNGLGQSGSSLPGGGGGSQGGRNDQGYAYGGSGYTINGSMDTSTRTGNGLITISIVNN